MHQAERSSETGGGPRIWRPGATIVVCVLGGTGAEWMFSTAHATMYRPSEENCSTSWIMIMNSASCRGLHVRFTEKRLGSGTKVDCGSVATANIKNRRCMYVPQHMLIRVRIRARKPRPRK